MQTQLEFIAPQQLNCPVCMAVMKIPITTDCGHSYCRSCLINSLKSKRSCPICRQQFHSAPQKIKQDQVLSLILQDMRQNHNKQKNKERTTFQCKGQKMLLIDAKTSDLILPYNRTEVSFELQNPILLNMLQKFVARQQYPYDKYGVICRIVSLNKLRFNVYECVLQGKSFCEIQSQFIQQGISQMEQQFSYRMCNAKQILQTSQVNLKQFDKFLFLFKQIKDHQILQNVYKCVDHKVFSHANDPVAMIYSIIGILDISKRVKYQIIIDFDEQQRMKTIKNVVNKVNVDTSYNVKGFIKVNKKKRPKFQVMTIIAITFIFLFLMNVISSDL